MAFKIEIKERKKEEWIKDLADFDYSLFLHPDWLYAIATARKEPFFIDLISNTQVIGKLSGLYIGNKWTNMRQLFCYSGPALHQKNHSHLTQCLEKFIQYAKKRSITRIIIASYDQSYSIPININPFFPNNRFEFNIPIETHTKKQYSKRFKNNLKKASKTESNYTTSSSPDHLKTLLNLLTETQKERITKKRNKYNPLFMPHMTTKSLTKLIQSSLTSFKLVKIGNNTHCIGLQLQFDKKSTLLLLGTSNIGYNKGLVAQLFHSFIKEEKELNRKNLNLGGIPTGKDGDNLSVFKLSMGAQKKMVYGATTNYLTFPYKLLNPLLNIGRKLPNSYIIFFIKKRI